MGYYKIKFSLNWLVFWRNIFIALCLVLTCSESQSQVKAISQNTNINGPLKFVEQTTINGDSIASFFSVWQPLVTNNMIYICDYRGDQILLYDKSGKFIKRIKGRGQGPKEFKMPYGLAMDMKGNLYVNDRGNQRVQIFDVNLNFIKTVSTPGQSERILLKERPNRFSIITVGVAGCKSEHCLLQEYDWTGKRINAFGSYTKEFITYSWAANLDDKGNLYIVNLLEQEVRVFDEKGREYKKIKLNSPTMRFLKTALNPIPGSFKELITQHKILNEEEHTEVDEIFVRNGFICVFLRLIRVQEPRMLLDIYTEKGELIYYGIEVPGWLFQVDNELHFVKYDDESDFGRAHFWAYRFTQQAQAKTKP